MARSAISSHRPPPSPPKHAQSMRDASPALTTKRNPRTTARIRAYPSVVVRGICPCSSPPPLSHQCEPICNAPRRWSAWKLNWIRFSILLFQVSEASQADLTFLNGLPDNINTWKEWNGLLQDVACDVVSDMEWTRRTRENDNKHSVDQCSPINLHG